jgi:choice-of-anchor B domain-containing protein
MVIFFQKKTKATMKYNIGLIFALVLTQLITIAQTPCVNGMAGNYPCNQVDLLAFVPLSAIGNGNNTNDIWGWVSPVSGKEYALIGCSNGTAFMDLSDPTAPIYLGLLPTHTVNSLWRDLETFGNYCYIVSEADNHGLQVFDLLQLDNVNNPPVNFSETGHYGGFGHCHTLTIDRVSGLLIASGTNTYSGGLHLVNISNPTEPALSGGFSLDGYTHDCYAWTYDGPDPSVQGKQLVFACNEDEVTIVDCTDPLDCFEVSHVSYNNPGYVHQGWFSKNGRYFLLDDETDETELGQNQEPYGTRTHLFDFINVESPVYMGYHEAASTAIDHNLYVKDQFIYESNYRSGVRILDAIKIQDEILTEVAFFDLYPLNDFAQYSGTWSNYPYLPSSINIATSMYEGIFILKPTFLYLEDNAITLCGEDQIYLTLNINSLLSFPLNVNISGLQSAVVDDISINAVGQYQIGLSNLSELTPGVHNGTLFLTAESGESYELPISIIINSTLPPSLNTPFNNEILNVNSPTLAFNWNNVSGAVSYTIQVAGDATFNTIIDEQLVTGNSYTLSFNLPIGQYWWRVRSSNECGDGAWAQANFFSVEVVGVAEWSKAITRFYPNPVTDQLFMEGNDFITEVIITDLLGRTALNVIPQKQTKILILDLSELSPGIYMVHSGLSIFRIEKK